MRDQAACLNKISDGVLILIWYINESLEYLVFNCLGDTVVFILIDNVKLLELLS